MRYVCAFFLIVASLFFSGCACRGNPQPGYVLNPTQYDVTVAFSGKCTDAYVFVPAGSYRTVALPAGYYDIQCTQHKNNPPGKSTGLSGDSCVSIDSKENDTFLSIRGLLTTDSGPEDQYVNWYWSYHGGIY